MLDIRYLRENKDEVVDRLRARGGVFGLENLYCVDEERRAILHNVEQLKERRNILSQEIGCLKKEGKDAEALLFETRKLASEIRTLDETASLKNNQLRSIMLTIPNLPHNSVPEGIDTKDNVEIRKWGEIKHFSFEPKDHSDIGAKLGILDMERAAKLSGARFALNRGAGALLERALMNLMLDLHTVRHEYVEMLPPFMVKEECLTGTGQLPKFEEDLFKIEGMEHYMIPTAEVPLTNIHRGEIIDENFLPLRYVAHTPCFRKEAGSYGRDVKGLIRQHQFNKVELVKFTPPASSYDELESLTADAENVLQVLGIPYRVVALCTGDLGFSAAKTYDIEVWLPGQGEYREISSCSNFEDFQARRANIRYRPSGGGKPKFIHTLNGSGLAVGRTLVAVLENYQEEDGSVRIPAALMRYMNDLERISAG